MGKLLFWMPFPPQGVTDWGHWQEFRGTMGAWVVFAVGVTAALIVLGYSLHARSRRIQSPADLFRPFTPLRWMWLAIVPVVALTTVFATEYFKHFPDAQVSPLGRAATTGLWAGLLALGIAFILIRVPFTPFTPARFRYRPCFFCKRWSGRRVAANR